MARAIVHSGLGGYVGHRPQPSRSRISASALRALAGQISLVLLAALIYFGVRGLTEGSVQQAIANGRQILRLEDRLGIDFEMDGQAWLLDHRWLVTLANWVYIWAHWPVIAATLVWLHHRHPWHYLLFRNAMFISGAIGLVIFIVYPVAPPRLMPIGMVDTVTELSHSYRVLQPPALVNKYAAMPSLHAGWNLLMGIALFTLSRHRLAKILGVAGPVLMSIAVVVTANHYVADPIVGIVVALIGLAGAMAINPRLYPHLRAGTSAGSPSPAELGE